MQGARKILGVICCAVGLVGCSGTYTTAPDQESADGMARQALEQLCSFEPQDLAAISADPSLVVPEVSTETREQWERHGGTTAVAVAVSGEQHPPDTAHSWNRKMDCTRFWPGFSEPFVDVYAVTATEEDGVWKIQSLWLI